MPEITATFIRNARVPLILLVVLATLLPRVFDLGAFQAADEKMWIANTNGFTRNLALFKWDQLLQQPHPGITTQWLGAPTINRDSLASKKMPLALSHSVLVILTGYIFYRLWGASSAMLLMALLALNPPLIAHTRIYAMDALLAHFLLLSIGCLLLWRKTDTTRYLIFAAVGGALAILSKLPGVIIIPFTAVTVLWWYGRNPKKLMATSGVWLLSVALTLVIVFPSLLLNFSEVMHLTKEFLLEGDAQDVHGPADYTYYLKSLAFFSTPLHLLTLIALPLFAIAQAQRRPSDAAPPRLPVEQIVILSLFAALFVLQMTLGAKKGDRYVLPAFLFLDAITAVVIMSVAKISPRLRYITATIVLVCIGWQAYDVARLHPHTLAYVNPITKQWYGDRRLGWGEGLDLAAHYLNQKPASEKLKVASLYPTEFAYNFNGEVIPLNHFDGSNADYVILYRALLERGPDAWETQIVTDFKEQKAEKVIRLGGLEYVWIYAIPRAGE